MGNVFSTDLARGDATGDVTSESETMSEANASGDGEGSEEFHDTIEFDEARARAKEDEMNEFRKELSIKREQRKQILARHRSEKEELEKSLEKEKKSKLELCEKNQMLRELLAQNNIQIPENLNSPNEFTELSGVIANIKEEFEGLKSNNNKLRKELAETNMCLQNANSDIADLNAQNTESIKHIKALKDVISVSKTMINLREQQLTELKNKLSEIEQSLADREANMLSADLRQEYERQLQNIRTLRGLYEERARLAEVTRQSLVRELEEQKLQKQAEVKKCQDLTAKVAELESTVNSLQETIENKKELITSYQDETRGLQDEMSAVNKLFSQVLLGYKTKQDLDKLVHRLEENHGLLTHMAEREHGSEASSALPKLLLEIISQVEERDENSLEAKTGEKANDTGESTTEDQKSEQADSQNPVNATAEEIVQNLPKVWRVLMELLSHQSEAEASSSEKVETCYKTVETKSGSVLVPSVSQTYIRLKDLIVEKLSLIKEVNRMKQLNGHLETRLEEQERRLSLVTTELSKTWHVVGRLRRHHHQLHTHEKILKYELQQKRKLLNELKEELEYCREKWEQAREKNSQSERDWRKLRAEFSSRKTKAASPSFNNSGESGYSDERPSDDSSESNDESEYVESQARCRKKNKKSFETVVDSSADFNLVAEREDPASDMLDVAELPLDAQDDNVIPGVVSPETRTTDNSLLTSKLSEETEDDIGEIANDSCIESTLVTEYAGNNETVHNIEPNASSKNTVKENIVASSTENVTLIDPSAILKSIKEQNERLAKKDEKLQNLEKSASDLLKKTQATDDLCRHLDSTLDHILNRPSSSQASHNETETKSEIISDSNNKIDEESGTENSQNIQDNKPIPEIDAATIHDSVRQQNEKLAEKDEGLLKFESDCSEDVKNVTNTIKNGDDLKLSAVESSDSMEKAKTVEDKDSSEPSTSSEIDHEARFAARDIRLKRLEEQTKSLVSKVNKTTSKGIKINYKLEELHNIYGSESSRAGTPSDDSEDRSQKNDEENTEE